MTNILDNSLQPPKWDQFIQVQLLSSPGYEDASAGDESIIQWLYDWRGVDDPFGSRRKNFKGGNIGWPKEQSNNQRHVWPNYARTGDINNPSYAPGTPEWRSALEAEKAIGASFGSGTPYEYIRKKYPLREVLVPSSVGSPNWTSSISMIDRIVAPHRYVTFGTGAIREQKRGPRLFLLAGIIPMDTREDSQAVGQLEMAYDGPDTRSAASDSKLWRRIPWYSIEAPDGEASLQYLWCEVPADCLIGESYSASGTPLTFGVRARWMHGSRLNGFGSNSFYGTGQDGRFGYLGFRIDRIIDWAVVATATGPGGGSDVINTPYKPPARGTLKGSKKDGDVVWTPRG